MGSDHYVRLGGISLDWINANLANAEAGYDDTIDNCSAWPRETDADEIAGDDIDEVFDEYDRNENDKLSRKELLRLWRNEVDDGKSKRQIFKFAKRFDDNRDGSLSRDEFREMAEWEPTPREEPDDSECGQGFFEYDDNEDLQMTKKEFYWLLKDECDECEEEGMSNREIWQFGKSLVKEFDEDGDGKLQWQEFEELCLDMLSEEEGFEGSFA